jgi:hypothetical protein
MSVQLILYPQGLIPDNPNEFVVNGINFTNLSSASTYSSSVATTLATPTALVQNVLTNAPPAISNLWYRFISTASATPAPPTYVANNAVFNSVGATSGSGIYQKMTNLIPGEFYGFNVQSYGVTASAGSISCAVYDGITLLTQALQSTNPAGSNFSFGNGWTQPAGSTTATIVLTYSSAFSQNFTIQTVSVQSAQLVSNITTSIEDGQVILDLYEDENIPLTLSVDEFKNVAEQVQSYSKAFNLPATKRNNQIFENLFEVTRSAQNSITFNPYVRSKSILKQDGFILFEGYLRVLDIQDKEGEISYNVNLYSEVVSFADTLKDKTFSQLSFTELEHEYNKTEIKNSWNDSGTGITYTNSSTSGYRDGNTTVKYPFVDWTHQMLISDGLSNNSTGGFPELTALEQAFRPFINIKYLIDRVFQDTEFTYESAFFNEADFKKLYMDFNWGDARTPMVFNNTTTATLFSTSYGIGTFNVNFLGITNSNFGYDTSTDIFTAIADNQLYNVSCSIIFSKASLGYTTAVQVEWVANINGVDTIFFPQTSPTIPLIGWVYVTNFSVTLNVGDTLRCRFTVLGPDPMFIPNQILPTPLTVVTSANETTDATLLGTLRGELEQWEFLKGIMTMFNLVASPDKSNPKNIIIEPYKDMFLPSIVIDSSTGLIVPNFFDDNSTQLDWTNKIDTTEIKLEVLTDLNKRTVFKFVEDDDDYAFNLYKTAVQGHLYGSYEFDASYFSGSPSVLEGEEEIEATPFAATVPKPLMSQFPDLITPAIYSYNADDGTSEGFENSPRIMYNNGIKSLALGTFTSCTYYIPAQNGVSSENANAFLQFSHLTDIPTVVTNPPDPDDTVDFHFGECQLIQPIGGSTPNNLFSTYWLPYFNELYNPDTRTMTLKVNLTPGDINTFFFYDTVFIKNRLFRVNKIDYKPKELATVEFILIP